MMEEKISFVKWLGQKKGLFLKEGLFAVISKKMKSYQVQEN